MTKIDSAGIQEEVRLQFDQNLSVVITDSIALISDKWNAHCGEIPYASSSYLNLLEEAGPIDYSYYYVIIKNQEEVLGLIYCQHKPLELHKDFRVHSHSDSLYEKVKVAITKSLFKLVKNDILICGSCGCNFIKG